jgi:hypothetical protein
LKKGELVDKWIKVLMLLTAAVFFGMGAISLPYGPWLSNNQDSNLALGWVTYLATVAIPWVIAFAIARYSLKKRED